MTWIEDAYAGVKTDEEFWEVHKVVDAKIQEISAKATKRIDDGRIIAYAGSAIILFGAIGIFFVSIWFLLAGLLGLGVWAYGMHYMKTWHEFYEEA